MNGPGHGYCYVDIYGEHDTWYEIKEDINCNSPLTGEGAGAYWWEEDENCHKNFTCVELEVY
jgi:hypothetical protein